MEKLLSSAQWTKQIINQHEIDKYLINGGDFVSESEIILHLKQNNHASSQQIHDILQKSLAIQNLSPAETAALLNVTSAELWETIFETALAVKRKVYDNRIVFFAPLYASNLCVNNCAYCGFRSENNLEVRRMLTSQEIILETQAILQEGHKRVVMVVGEHQNTAIEYLCEAIKAAYSVEYKSIKTGCVSRIRRVNVNAAPMEIGDLKRLKEAGIGTYQVFQETYHHQTYQEIHPANTVKGNYRWRLYAHHRALEAGLDDVAIGALFGLYDWRFEVMGLVYHALDLERQFGIGPHTISFPRLNPALGSELSTNSPWQVSDADFKKLVAVLRLAVPTAGLIITAREKAELKKEVIQVGCTQTDASTRIGVGSYSTDVKVEHLDSEQFVLGDSRNLDELIQEMIQQGNIPSFCTAGYRCGRTGETIMGMLSKCDEGKFCKLNAVLTFREYLNDFASDSTRILGESILQKEMASIESMAYFKNKPHLLQKFHRDYGELLLGKRDVYI